MMLPIEERIFLVEHVFRANREYTKEVKQVFLERYPTTDLPHRNMVNLVDISEFCIGELGGHFQQLL